MSGPLLLAVGLGAVGGLWLVIALGLACLADPAGWEAD